MSEYNNNASPQEEEKSGFRFPTAYTVLFILLILVVIATWFIPAGQYEKNEDGEPIPGSYHPVEQNPQKIIADGLMAPVNGMYGIEGEDGTISVYNWGALYGAILRSPHAHARIVHLDTSRAEKLKGVAAVITSAGTARKKFGRLIKDEELLATDKVRHVGDEVAVVAAVDKDIAEQPLSASRYRR